MSELEEAEAAEAEKWQRKFPVYSGPENYMLDDALPHLRRPFEPPAVRWKVQSVGQGWGVVVAYIDARLVMERLNLVVGAGWSDEYRQLGANVEECALTVCGVTRRDVGKAQGMEAEKSARSDALKRTAVKFGVGTSIYAIRSVFLKAHAGNEPTDEALLTKNKEGTGNRKGKWSATISDAAAARLAGGYARWLESPRGLLFGPPLGHGDEEGAQGLEAGSGSASSGEVPEAEAPVEPAGSAQVEGPEADALRLEASAVHAEISKMNAALIPKAKARADMVRAGRSLEGLQAYVGELKGVRDRMVAERMPQKAEGT